jgi:hypothetical protein
VTANNDADKALLKRFRLFGPPGIIFFDAAGAERTGCGWSASSRRGLRQGARRGPGPLGTSRIRAKTDIIRLNRGALQGTGATRRPRLDVSAGTPAPPTALTRPCFVCKPVPGTGRRGEPPSHAQSPPGHTFEEIS